MSDRLLDAITDMETALSAMQVEGGYRRDWGPVILAEWPWHVETDYARPRVQLSYATQGSGGPRGYEKAGDLHHYTEEILVSVNVKPDIREDGVLDIISPVQDFRADVHKALMGTALGRNRGLDRHMATYYLGRRTAFLAESIETLGARTTEVYGLLWAHKTGNMEAGPGSA